VKTTSKLFVAAAAMTLVCGPVGAVTRTLGAVRDNTLYEVSSAASALSNGAGIGVFTGRTAQGSNGIRRGLVAFNFAAAVPSGATVTSAQLTLDVTMTTSGSEVVSLHRLSSDWGESSSDAPGQEGSGASAEPGDATWFHTFFPSAFWGNPGGDFAAGASATVGVAGDGTYTWGSTSQMVADVQTWVDNPSSNFGWLLFGAESRSATAKRFSSREGGSGPQLVVSFGAPVPTTGEYALVILATLLATLGVLTIHRRSITI